MITKLRKRIESEKGFTLIEMLIVIIILGILIAIAVPAYLSFRDKANQRAATANIRAAVPAIEDYHGSSATGSYDGMDLTKLQAIDPAIKGIVVKSASGQTYCVESTVAGKKSHKKENVEVVEGSLCT